MSKIDTDAICNSVDIADVVGKYLPLKKSGPEYRCCCPFHDEKTPSFSVVPAKQMYYCFGCGAGGDVIDFVQNYTGCDFREACASITGDNSLTAMPVRKEVERVNYYDGYSLANIGEGTEFPAAGKKVSIINPKRDGSVWSFEPEAVYPYGLHGYVLRTSINGKKVTPQIRYCKTPNNKVAWCCFPFDESNRPIYGLDKLKWKSNESKQVLIVEGEKAKDHLDAALEGRMVVISWSGGTSAAERTDWSLLKGRKILLWPDNDRQGIKAMAKIAELSGAAVIKKINPPANSPKGWDGADQKWQDSDSVMAFMRKYVITDGDWPELCKHCAVEMTSSEVEYLGESCDECEVKNEAMREAKKPEPEEDTEIAQPPVITDSDDWKKNVMWKDASCEEVASNVNNAMLFMAYHGDMEGVLAYNSFANTVDILSAPPWAFSDENYPRSMTDIDSINATAWLELRGFKLGINTVHSAMIAASHKHKFNPLQSYINGLEWDGKSRIETMLLDHFGCYDRPYTRAISRRFLIAAAARALNPGCKVDTVLILEGTQGLKKSSAVSALFGPEFFTDELSDFGSKDAAMQLQGTWCVEIAELSTMGRADANRIKEWIPRQVDRFRPPFGRCIIDAPRHCVFVGTVNPEGGYLKDSTGGRRFWPAACEKIDLPGITKNRDQLWAEAAHYFKSGEQWWLTDEEEKSAKDQQERRYESDPWTDAVNEYIALKEMVSIKEVMEYMDLPSSQQSQIAQNRISKVLVLNNWHRRRRRVDGVPHWVYVKDVKK